jgi:hypothetical protein
MLRRIVWGSIFSLVALAAEPTIGASAGSQSYHQPTRRLPVTVALVDRLPQLNQEYAAVILRISAPHSQDVILLRRATASGEILDAATRTLLHSRVRHGARPTSYNGKQFRVLTLGVRMSSAPTSWAQREIPLAQRVVDRLRSVGTPLQTIPGVGKVPAVDFVPPSVPTFGTSGFIDGPVRQ